MKNKKGITLIALIITIIVMLILVAVSVQILIKSDLIGTTESAAEKYKTAHEEEQNMGKVIINGKEYASIESYTQSKCNHEYDENEICKKCGKKPVPEVGDYVNIILEGTPNSEETKYSIPRIYSGYDEEQTAYMQETKWRVLKVNNDGTYDLISESGLYIGKSEDNETGLYLKGATGYNNGVEILNELCDTLYGSGDVVASAKNLSVEELNDFTLSSLQTEVYQPVSNDTGTAKVYLPDRWFEIKDKGVIVSEEGLDFIPSTIDEETGTIIANKTYAESNRKLFYVEGYWNTTIYNYVGDSDLITPEGYYIDSWLSSRTNYYVDDYFHIGSAGYHFKIWSPQLIMLATSFEGSIYQEPLVSYPGTFKDLNDTTVGNYELGEYTGDGQFSGCWWTDAGEPVIVDTCSEPRGIRPLIKTKKVDAKKAEEQPDENVTYWDFTVIN